MRLIRYQETKEYVHQRYWTKRKRKGFLVRIDTAAVRVVIAGALRSRIDPTGQSVCNITGVTVSGDAILKLASAWNGSWVINTSSSVKSRNIIGSRFIDAVSKAIAAVSTSSTLADHLINSCRGARVLDVVVLIAGGSTIVVLHEARISNSKVGRRSTDTAVRFLHDDSQDKSMVNTSGSSSHLNTIPDRTLLNNQWASACYN